MATTLQPIARVRMALQRKRLRSARQRAGYTQAMAAITVGISMATLQNAESGRREPSASTIASLAALYGVALEWLFLPVHAQEPDGFDPASGNETRGGALVRAVGTPADSERSVTP